MGPSVYRWKNYLYSKYDEMNKELRRVYRMRRIRRLFN